MRQYRKWLPEVDEMLREMFTAGCDVREMSRVVDRPIAQVYTRLHALDLQLSSRTAEPDREEFKRIMHLRTGKEF